MNYKQVFLKTLQIQFMEKHVRVGAESSQYHQRHTNILIEIMETEYVSVKHKINEVERVSVRVQPLKQRWG